jgi:hypothetical protein
MDLFWIIACPVAVILFVHVTRQVETKHVVNVSTTRLLWQWCYMVWRSPNLCACYYFLWGCLKSKFFISKPRTTGELKQRMKEETALILEQMARRVMENLRERVKQCLSNDGTHLRDEILKNKMACTEFFSDSKCYLIRWKAVVLFSFESRQVFLPHTVLPLFSSYLNRLNMKI